MHHHHGSIMPEDAEVVRSYIIAKLQAEGVAAYIIKEDPKSSWPGYSKDTEVHWLKDASTYQDQCV
jgi:hypothetical protein